MERITPLTCSKMKRIWIRARRLLFLLLLVFFHAGALPVHLHAQEAPDQQKINLLSNLIVEAMKKLQNENGSFYYIPGNNQYLVGTSALVLYALSSAGVPEDDPTIRKGVEFLNSSISTSTYEEGLVLCALEKINPRSRKNRERMELALKCLLSWQGTDGGWGYGMPITRSDESCSQYAVLGLSAAVDAGFHVPEKVLMSVRRYYLKQQHANGSWGYLKADGTVSMTCAGLASLTLLGEKPDIPIPERCGTYRGSQEMRKGLQWLGKHSKDFLRKVERYPNGYGYYALYGMERVGILNGIREFGNTDWYTEGCFNVLEKQRWSLKMTDMAFVLLFIARNSAPYAICKWEWNGDWNPDKFDIRNWTERASKELKRPLDWQTSRLDSDEALARAGRSSMIFLSGHGVFKASGKELENLRKFLEAGGVVVAEPCCGDRTFLRTFRNVMENDLEPGKDLRFRKIASEHPLMNTPYLLDERDTVIYNLRKGCSRKQIYLLEDDISCTLNGDNPRHDDRRKDWETAINLLAYSLNRRKAHGKFESVQFQELSVEEELNSKAVRGSGAVYSYENPLGRIRFDGEWDSDPNFIRNLAENQDIPPEVPLFDAQIPINPESEDIFACRMLLLSGHGVPRLSPKAVVNLQKYLRSGGKLLVEACCGDAVFDNSFRALCQHLFPGRSLLPIPEGDPVYSVPTSFTEKAPESTVMWKKQYGSDKIQPLYGIRGVGNNWDMIYLPYDITCAMEGDLEEDIPALKGESAVRLFTNLLFSLLGLNDERNGK